MSDSIPTFQVIALAKLGHKSVGQADGLNYVNGFRRRHKYIKFVRIKFQQA